jgi:hypothetical protein
MCVRPSDGVRMNASCRLTHACSRRAGRMISLRGGSMRPYNPLFTISLAAVLACSAPALGPEDFALGCFGCQGSQSFRLRDLPGTRP